MSKAPVAPLKVLIACGGTGGHLFPGIAVAQELKKRGHEVRLLISEKAVDAEASKKYQGLDFETVEMVAKPRTLSLAMIGFLIKVFKTIGQCRKIIEREKANVVLGMGGFTSFPPVKAGAARGLRTYVHDSNAVPGKSNLLTAKSCTRVLLGLEKAASHFPNSVVEVTGTPVRDELESLPERTEALQKFGLKEGLKTLLVMGGSQGARKLNEIIAEGTEGVEGWQVLHLAGRGDFERLAKQVAGREHYHVLAFCDDMGAAYAASDFCVARSGASSLTELSTVGLPALLVPYPYAADDHQTANAEVYVEADAAVMRQERDLDRSAVQEMFAELNDEVLSIMGEKMRAQAVPDAAEKIAKIIEG